MPSEQTQVSPLLPEQVTLKNTRQPQLAWLSGFSIVLQKQKAAGLIPGPGTCWVVGSVPIRGAEKRQLMDISLSHVDVSLPLAPFLFRK